MTLRKRGLVFLCSVIAGIPAGAVLASIGWNSTYVILGIAIASVVALPPFGEPHSELRRSVGCVCLGAMLTVMAYASPSGFAAVVCTFILLVPVGIALVAIEHSKGSPNPGEEQ